MVQQQSILSVPIIWRGNKYALEINSEASILELGEELKKFTDVKADTMKLIVPQSSTKSSKLFAPFSDEHSSIRLQDAGIIDGKPLRMMGVLENEVDQLLKDSQAKLRIPGFEEEERRMKERLSRGPRQSLKLPQGPYIFGDFRTLEIPGIELNPPPSEALKRMHMLAADPGIVAIMNKHRWRVGIMTEMAPVGKVGISPVCLLGLNKNHGEEISLRLRTDDLKGFRKYDVIKKTLLHELAHMVFSEHDENFYALDKQLNQEAFALDWTQSTSHTLANTRFSTPDDSDMDFEPEINLPMKLGGDASVKPANARVAAASAAFHRLADSSTIPPETSIMTSQEEPDFDDSEVSENKMDYSEAINDEEKNVESDKINDESGDHSDSQMNSQKEPEFDDSEVSENKMDNSERINGEEKNIESGKINDESGDHLESQMSDDSAMGVMTYEPDHDDEELRRVQDPVTILCNRLSKAIKMLRNEVDPSEVEVVQQTLFKIIRNASENPNEMKYKRLRKANPIFQRSIANSKAALQVLSLVGFVEEVVTDEIGKTETYLVLKRDDPGLLWLAKSSLEMAFARS